MKDVVFKNGKFKGIGVEIESGWFRRLWVE